MNDENKSRPSFSTASRLRIGFDLALRTALVLAVVGMVNFLGAKFHRRFYLSAQTRVELSSRTLTILHSFTNHVEVTLYYDTQNGANFYPDIVELLNAYHDANRNITIRTVDHVREPAEALKIKEKFNLAASLASPDAAPAKDLVIFACGDRHDVVPGAVIVGVKETLMATNDPDYDPKEKRPQFSKTPVAFNGEVLFTSKLLAITRGEPLRACFLQRHGEPSLTDTTENGYQKFKLALAQNDIALEDLDLLGAADVPADCRLLVIAAPIKEFDAAELQKIDTYLAQGGKLLALLNYLSLKKPTGLETLLQRWGVNVMADYVIDPKNSESDTYVAVENFNPKTFVNPLMGLALEMVLPRPVLKIEQAGQAANAPQVEPLIASSEAATLAGNPAVAPRSYSLIASVEQKPVAGATNPRGNLRIVVAGDSLFLNNQLIDAAADRDFLNYAVNWLCDREQLLAGVSPRPVSEFRLMLTQKLQRQLMWLLLGALPGGVLLLGCLVSFVRRK